jgi:hypothetical protein
MPAQVEDEVLIKVDMPGERSQPAQAVDEESIKTSALREPISSIPMRLACTSLLGEPSQPAQVVDKEGVPTSLRTC